MKHSHEADLSAEMLGISRDGLEGLGHGVEQDAVHHGFVLQGDGGDRLRHGKHAVEIFTVEQFRSAVLDPRGAGE